MTNYKNGDMAFANIHGELKLVEIATVMDDDLVRFYIIGPKKGHRVPSSCHKNQIQIAWVLCKPVSEKPENEREITKQLFYKEPASSGENCSFIDDPKDATCFPYQDEAARVLSSLEQQESIVPLEYNKIVK